jgi:ketosteroid isomerase-like protein
MTTATLTSTREIIASLYEAFSKGDIPFILDSISDEFTWQDPCNPSIVPFGGRYEGKSGMGNFFQNLGGSVDTTLFNVDSFTSEGDKVVGTGQHGFTVRKNGKKALLDWAMVWKFKGDLPVAGRSYYNTAASENAFKD